jgi:energy-coupling factor transporter ATP-binding protein EcfA2
MLHREGQTILVVTHEAEIAQRCRRVVRLRDGQVESDGQHDAPASSGHRRPTGGPVAGGPEIDVIAEVVDDSDAAADENTMSTDS